MTQNVFWTLMALLDWKKLGNDNAVVRPLVKALAKLTVTEIFAFDDILAEKLHDLDTEAHARHMGEDSYKGPDEFFSVDYFLYTRCAVVANGQRTFEEILKDPKEFPEDRDFEAILYVASTAYEKKTGKEYRHTPPVSYETFCNKKGWARGKKIRAHGTRLRPPKEPQLLLPLWMYSHGLSPRSPKWKTDDLAAYRLKWTIWFEGLSTGERKDYIETFFEPKAWRGFYKSLRK